MQSLWATPRADAFSYLFLRKTLPPIPRPTGAGRLVPNPEPWFPALTCPLERPFRISGRMAHPPQNPTMSGAVNPPGPDIFINVQGADLARHIALAFHDRRGNDVRHEGYLHGSGRRGDCA